MSIIASYYRYCEDCKEFVDLWKFDSISDTGHEGHNFREVTAEEFLGCLNDCKQDGCFDEEFLSSIQTQNQNDLLFVIRLIGVLAK